ncbi:MAG: hypothetical protein KAT09_08195 [Candidatus Aegiribacteria sp.]|nr:hypothetical protein [Candidatus Aegiribacteria sp.]
MKILCMILMLPFICLGASVDRTHSAPDGNICGLAWGEGRLWCLDESSSWVYGLDPLTGDVDVSFKFTGYSSYAPAGLTYYDGKLFGSFINGSSSTYVYWYSTSGSYGGYDIFC